MKFVMSYKKAWKAKQKALTIQIRDWEESYNRLLRWLQVLEEIVLVTIIQYTSHLSVVDSVEDHSTCVSFGLSRLALTTLTIGSL